MKLKSRRLFSVAVAAALAAPSTAMATNGYFAYGFGTAAKGMAGVATALPQDTLVAATNPAGMVFLGDRLDVDVSFFNPSPRGFEANPDFATAIPNCDGCLPPGHIGSGEFESNNDWFVIPSFGYNHMLDDKSSIGVSIGGNGGMNTEYDSPVFQFFAGPPNLLAVPGPVPGSLVPVQPFPSVDQTPNLSDPRNINPGGTLTATSPTGIDMAQLLVGVSYARKIGVNQSIGITPVFAIQRIKVEGLEPFRAASVSPENVTNNGYDYSYGGGVQVGWFGEVNKNLSLGISYRTPLYMTKLDKYKGLFAEGGKFDIPAVLNIGLAYKLDPKWTAAFDYQRISYHDVPSLGNSNNVDLAPCFAPGPKPVFCLGANNGLGFGWGSLDVFKLGVKWDYDPRWTFRAGISYSDDFIQPTQALFNILAPATVKTHLTFGVTFRPSSKDAINFSYAHAFKETLEGTNASITGPQTGNIFMEQNEIEIGWSHSF